MDLNADLGESFGRWTLGDAAALMPYLTSANVAAGFHGGDPHVLRRTVPSRWTGASCRSGRRVPGVTSTRRSSSTAGWTRA
jgi:LamB/YcsF family